MKKNRGFALVLAAVMAFGVIAFAGCGEKFTVTFDTVGGGTVESQRVASGGTATEPAAPEKVGHDFAGWHIGNTRYDFSTPVTKDITLVAFWTLKEFTVTFKSEGTVLSSVDTFYSALVEKPETPTRAGYVFDGWYNGNTKYDFDAAVEDDLELTAKWIDEREANVELRTALEKEYNNYTAVRVVNEVYEGETLTDTYTYKRTATEAHTTVDNGLVKERFTVFGSDKAPLKYYYLDKDNAWQKSPSGFAVEYYVPLKTGVLEADDFVYLEGRYYAATESFAAVEAALFNTMSDYTQIYLELKDGQISVIGGSFAGFVGDFTMTFSDVGTTTVQRPALPDAEVLLYASDKTLTEGEAVDAADIRALFDIKSDGNSVTVTDEMIDLGGLDLANPAVGEYTVTLTYTAWDSGGDRSITATVTVNAKQASTEDFATIFAKDYTNATIAYNNTTYKRNGDVFSWKLGVWDYCGVITANSLSYNCAKYKESDSATAPTKFTSAKIPRLDMIFGLSATLFVEDGEKYVLNGSEALDASVVTTLNNIFKANELATAVVVTNDLENCPFSIKLTVNGDHITKIEYSYYAKAGASLSPALKSCVIELSDIGSTAAITISDAVRAIVYPA